jgi:uncharacterized membrane protein
MSFDPYDNESDAPRRSDRYDDDRPPFGDHDRIKGRVQAPAICLIVIGILNLFFALYMVLNSVLSTAMSAEKLKAQQMQIYEALPPSMREDASKKTAAEMKTQAMLINWPLTLFALLASILPIAGGIRMMSLKSYALGVCGAIVAAIPCISITACCGLGEGIGIWALVVLLNPDVKSAFR